MARPYTDISRINSNQPIKNGTVVTTCTKRGYYNTYDEFVLNTPNISTIQAKYGYRFYNGTFVELIGNQTVVGG